MATTAPAEERSTTHDGPAVHAQAPALPRIRQRLLYVGVSALLMVAVAVFASLVGLVYDRHVQHQYEDSLAMSHLAFDAESLASRLRALRELSSTSPAPAGSPGPILRGALRALDVDIAEWERRTVDAQTRSLPEDALERLARLAPAIATLRGRLGWPAEDGAPGGAGNPAGGSPGSEGADFDQAYLLAVEAAQGALLASVRAGNEHAFHGYTIPQLISAVVVAASALALALGATHVLLINQERHETRAAIGVMGEMLRTDPLTGITNRRGLDENLPVEMARASRGTSTLSVAMLDLDYFKRYNSRRGHAGGDALLRAAAQSWRKQLRPTDTLVRYGGEEFTLVLPSCDAEQACLLISRLRPLLPDNQTFSAGVATWDFQESPDALLRRADHALLLAKKTGRNRTMVSGREDQINLPLTAG